MEDKGTTEDRGVPADVAESADTIEVAGTMELVTPVEDSSDVVRALLMGNGENDELGGAEDSTPLDSKVGDDNARLDVTMLDPVMLEIDETKLLLEGGLTDGCEVESTTVVVGESDCCADVSSVDVLKDVKTGEDACVSILSAAGVLEDVADVVTSELAVLEAVLMMLELVEPIAVELGVRSDIKMGGVVAEDMVDGVALENIGASEGRILKVCGGSVGVSGGSGGSGGSGSSRTNVKACIMAEVNAIVVNCSSGGSSVAVTVVVTVDVTMDVFSPDTVINQ